MPIYEYYCPDNHTVYQFYAKTLAQGNTVPRCPDNPRFRMKKIVSAFAVQTRKADSGDTAAAGPAESSPDDPRMEAAMSAMEREFANVDENDPRAMGRMMRRMAELTGEKIDGEMEEVVRKLEEGADPDSLDEQFGDAAGDESEPCGYGDTPEPKDAAAEEKEKKFRFKTRRAGPRRDPKLYDYE